MINFSLGIVPVECIAKLCSISGSMIITGIGDEAASGIDGQIKAHETLGWKWIEMRGVEVPGFSKANFHEIPDAAFDVAAGKLKDAGIRVYCFGSTIMNGQKTVATPFDVTLVEVKRCIRGMQRFTSTSVTSNGVATVFCPFMIVEPKQYTRMPASFSLPAATSNAASGIS